jgi:lipopolysaccharide biosynthesis glycosyltransferase
VKLRDNPDYRSIWIGFDPREADAFAVARESIKRRLNTPLPINGIVLDDMRGAGLYRRPTQRPNGKLWDEISEAAMSTEFAISRFLTPHLARDGWALFVDCDVMAMSNIEELFGLADPSKAVMCVKHNFAPPPGVKMDGQEQTRYARKNWSSVMLFNVKHPANKALTVELINTVPGRDLHRFCWLDDEDIGEIGPEWNWLVGHSSPNLEPKLIHYTDGIPSMRGYESQPFAAQWRAELSRWAR